MDFMLPTGEVVKVFARAIDEDDGRELVSAMAVEIESMYGGLDIDAPGMPAAGAAQLGPPNGGFFVGYVEQDPVACGGFKRLPDGACEIKRMYVKPQYRGLGVARFMLRYIEERAREAGYKIARLSSGDKQQNAKTLYLSAGYTPIGNFSQNPVATFFGEKKL